VLRMGRDVESPVYGQSITARALFKVT